MFGDYKILQKNLALITCLMVEGMVNPEYILRAIFILMGALSGMKVSCANLGSQEPRISYEDFDLAYADTGLNSHVNIFNLYGPYSSYFCSICSPDRNLPHFLSIFAFF